MGANSLDIVPGPYAAVHLVRASAGDSLERPGKLWLANDVADLGRMSVRHREHLPAFRRPRQARGVVLAKADDGRRRLDAVFRIPDRGFEEGRPRQTAKAGMQRLCAPHEARDQGLPA